MCPFCLQVKLPAVADTVSKSSLGGPLGFLALLSCLLTVVFRHLCPSALSAPDPLSPVRHELSCFRFWDTGHSAPSPSPNHAHHLQQFPVCTSPPSIIFFLQVWIFPLHSLLAVNIGVPQRGECKHLSLSRRHTPKLWFSFDLLDDEDSPFCI